MGKAHYDTHPYTAALIEVAFTESSRDRSSSSRHALPWVFARFLALTVATSRVPPTQRPGSRAGAHRRWLGPAVPGVAGARNLPAGHACCQFRA